MEPWEVFIRFQPHCCFMIKGRKALKAISVRWWQPVSLQTCCLTVCLQTCPCTSAEQWQQAVPFSAPPWNDHPTPTGCTPSGKDPHAFCAQEPSGSLLAQKCSFCLCQPLYRVKAKKHTHSSNKKSAPKLEIKDIIKVTLQNVNVISLNNITMTSVADRYWEEGGGEENWKEVRMEMWRTLPFH